MLIMSHKITVIVSVALATVVADRRSYNVAKAEKVFPLGSSYPENIYEDALLDAPSIIEKYGYPVEVHHVTTEDGYILEAHRIPHGRHDNHTSGNKTVVFLMHGLTSSATDYIILGPGRALAYILADNGYDVWMGNARGNYYSRHHEELNPDKDAKFWHFSWDDIGIHDLPAFIDYILDLTGQTKLHYVGHSQGGTTFLVLNSLKPEYKEKFISFQGLAPVAYFTHFNDTRVRDLAKFEKMILIVADLLGLDEVWTNEQAHWVYENIICSGYKLYDLVCIEKLQNTFPEWKGINKTMLPVFLAHSAAGASLRQIAHYAQVINRDCFARFDFGFIKNLLLYGSFDPPEYNISDITVPSYIYYGSGDQEDDMNDVLELAKTLPNVKYLYSPKDINFNHMEFIWGDHAKEEIYDVLVKKLIEAEHA